MERREEFPGIMEPASAAGLLADTDSALPGVKEYVV